ncbi:tripartite tricarboxylate transporter substrate binding protein [Roseomonas frigidaquae]|uniref:Tripartite tricarboxylate transporter substrate binding protein n=1 Tax=Falsiroseomonas frigidaquae TaxID=487318 RepID=A0ABX1F3S2_9PROT|nr:tripartite tricarboxylate transporter substrate-binding protein [Falsiroseomonas frigidaquae]NKE46995.1 tripartite tricarboxylate transporter substrate binding protein [Falsiroseomonas frigidaquae]
MISATRRSLLATPFLLTLPAGAQAQAWNPGRPVRVILPYPPGGGTDILARAVAEAMRPALGHPVLVENRPGANGAIGSDALSKADGDGTTIGMVTSTHTLNKYVMASLSYDPLADFRPIAKMTTQTLVMVSGTAQPFNDVAGLLAAARARPGAIGFGQTEAVTRFAGTEFARLAGVQMEDVPYRGGGLMMNDIVAGHLPCGWTSTASAMPHLSTGRVRVLCVSTAQRTPLMPDVPTAQEAGVAGYDIASWVGMFGPKSLPLPLAEQIHAAVATAYRDPALVQRFQTLGLEMDLRPPAAFAEFLVADDARWAEALRHGRIQKAG